MSSLRLPVLLLLAIAFLSACGGSSGATSATSTPTPSATLNPTPIPTRTPTPTPELSMKVNFYRVSGYYEDWGLHLWNTSPAAIAAADVTIWAEPRPFDGIDEAGWAYVEVPLVDVNGQFNFIVHWGDVKNSPDNLQLVASSFGDEVWVVQDSGELFSSLEAATPTVAALGSVQASDSLDLSAVAVGDTASPLPVGWQSTANFMEIYVRAYKDSNGDGIGDLQGLISQLDYLQDLGITGIWLMPVHQSSDKDHGYAVTDYREIESDYGTLADFQELLAAAHSRGIGIIIDYVINHSSFNNPLFVDANFSSENPKRDWYIFSDEDLGWGPWGNGWRGTGNGDFFYSPFSVTMPDFNLANPEVGAFHRNNLRHWLNMGVAGFRFDAVGLLFEDANGSSVIDNANNHPFLATMLDVVNSYDNRFLVCEAADDPEAYVSNNSCSHAFAFGVQWNILESARDRQVTPGFIDYLNHPDRDLMPLFLSNHDSFAGNRPMTYFLGEGITSDVVDNYLKVVASIYILASATPFVYYGEEVGMAGSGNDAFLRTPMSWTNDTTTAGFTTGIPFRAPSTNVSSYNFASQESNSDSIFAHYRTLLNLRRNNPVLATGDLNVQSSVNNSYLIFTRSNETEEVAVLINLDLTAQEFTVNLAPDTSYSNALPGGRDLLTDGAGNITVELAAQSVMVLVKALP